jgi:predicted AlkP superfamily phosphohydrolase/phosphomutase
MGMRLYFLGLDGLAASIIFDPDHRGRWPNLEQLCAESLYGPCDCEAQYIFTGPSWTSIYTGQPAEVHGLTDLWGRPLNGSRAFPTVKEPYIWEVLNRHGLTCGVVTMPITYPARPIRNYMIAGFPSPRRSPSPPTSWLTTAKPSAAPNASPAWAGRGMTGCRWRRIWRICGRWSCEKWNW